MIMEPSKEAIAVRITRLNRQILGKVTSGSKFIKKTIDREALLDALTVLYDECNEDPIKKNDELVRAFVDRYRSTLAELRRARVCISDFEIIQTIGRGHFGEVHMVREKQTGDVYALKILRKELARKRAAGAAEDERDVLANANTAWVPKLQYAFQDTNSLYLVMELCSGGDLAGLLSRRNHPLDEQDAAFYVAEVAHALKALHAMGYVHRDVKPNNILLDRCGHVKLGDFGSCARLSSEEAGACPVGTADYVAPELLAAVDCAQRHSVCSHLCQGIVTTALSACDYWSLGVVAFELVTLKRPFSTTDDDTMSQILANIQNYERDPNSEPPFDPLPYGPSSAWRALVAGLLRVNAARRYNYLDTLQHAALAHHNTHAIRDQAPPWVPSLRGAEDASCFMAAPRVTPPPSAAPFRARDPFAGQLPFIGYSFVAPDESEEHHSGSFSTSHDCTAIDMATFKSAEKLAAIRGREVGNLQSKVTSLEAACGAASERARRAEADAERQRARAQADVTALALQNKRLERQVDVEKEERMALERTIQELKNGIMERNNSEVRAARAAVESVEAERDLLRADVARLQARVNELQADAARARADADHAQLQQRHYKDTIAKERALRRQTLTGGEVESRETGAKLAAAEAQSAKETRARELAEKKLQQIEADNQRLKAEIDEARRELVLIQESFGENQRIAVTSRDQLSEVQLQLTQEKIRASTLLAQVQELERSVEEAHRREAALEEQCQRTEARLKERLDAADARAASALQDDTRHREKVSTLEQLVRQLEREVGSLEKRVCLSCEEREKHAHSDTESVDGIGTNTHTQAQVSLLKEQLERAEAQLLARAEEIASLKQEARSANLARWRKEREFTDLQSETKTTSRDLKRAEDRLSAVLEAKKAAEKKAAELQSALDILKPQHERLTREAERTKDKLETIQKTHDKLQAEVDRSRNDIRKLKSELQYSEKRRLHAEQQEELSSRERASIRDELTQLQHQHQQTLLNNKALQEACSLLEEQLTDLEKLADINEVKSKDLEEERGRLRSELSTCRARLHAAERAAGQRAASAQLLRTECDAAEDRARNASDTIRELTVSTATSNERGRLRSELSTCRARLHAAERAAGQRAASAQLLRTECDAAEDRARNASDTIRELTVSTATSNERGRLRSELSTCRARLHAAERAAGQRAASAQLLRTECDAAEDRARNASDTIRELTVSTATSNERGRLRSELSTCRARLHAAERAAGQRAASAQLLRTECDAAEDRARNASDTIRELTVSTATSNERGRLRSELSTCRARLHAAERAAGQRAASAQLLRTECDAAEDRARNASDTIRELTVSTATSNERGRLRSELSTCRARLHAAERAAGQRAASAQLLRTECDAAEDRARNASDTIRELTVSTATSNERGRLRSELSTCRARLHAAERAAGQRAASAQLLRTECDAAEDRARNASDTIRELTERLEARSNRVSELEAQVTQLESQLCAKELALSGAARQLQELHEESASLRTRLHHHRAEAAQLQELLASANEQLAEAQEAASAAAAWWRARDTKADATLRQQAKLIDFLQAKLEEAGRKKCSLSNKLFGRSGRRANTSPPLARANRELREEIDRLRAKLASQNSLDNYPPTTPRKDRSKPVFKNLESIDSPDGDDKNVQIVWSDGSREKMRTRLSNDKLVLTSPAGLELKATVLPDTVPNVPTNEANRSIAIRVENSNKGCEAALVCSDISSLALPSARPACWAPKLLASMRVEPLAALFIDAQTVAIGCCDGLQSLRGGVQLRAAAAAAAAGAAAGVRGAAAAGARALLLWRGAAWHASLRALASALRRAASLQPALELKQLILPDSQPHLIKVMTGESSDDRVVVACGRRVFLLKWVAASSEYRVSRSLTVDRAPDSLLLTHTTLYIAGEKPLKINLPSGVLESFGNDVTVSAAARRKSPPRAIFLIKEKPVEILICYSECGVFLDETGRRTRNDDPKWNTSVNSLEFVYPFLYVCSADQITIIYISDDAYRAPPCTCDSEPPSSATSNASDYIPPTFTYKASELAILGPAPNGVVIRWRNEDKYEVSYLDGLAAFRSVGASVESLETVSDSRGSSVDLAHEDQQNDSPEETSVESIDETGFLADIRKRARQIKKKNMSEQTRDDVIKQILTTEIGLKRQSNGRKSPVTTSEFDSDSDSEDNTESKNTADLCAEMFTRQVRFQ